MERVERVKSAARADWRRVTEREFEVFYLEHPHFTGCVTKLNIHAITEPLYVTGFGEQFCVANTGFVWLQHFPEGTHYTMTTMLDAAGRVVHWYFDICKEHGVDEAGVPWWYDLYLDIVALPTGEAEIFDGDELETALLTDEVTQEEAALAWREADALLEKIQKNRLPLLELSLEHMKKFCQSRT